MKVCRMCWTLLDDQLDRCNCIIGDTDGVFFKDVGEAINHFVNHEKRMNARYRKLFHLVEEELKQCKQNAGGMVYGQALQSLLDESKRNE